MLRGLWKLTWLELKIFLREPLGVAGTIGIPVIVFDRDRPDDRRAQAGPAGRPSLAVRRREHAGVRGAADRAERGVVAGGDHGDLPRGRNSEAAARDTAASGHDPDRPRARQAADDGGDVRADDAGREALLSRAGGRASPERHAGAAADDGHRVVAGLRRREPGADGALRAADRQRPSLSDGGPIRVVRPAGRPAAGIPDRRSPVAADLRVFPAEGNLDRRAVVRPRDGRRESCC